MAVENSTVISLQHRDNHHIKYTIVFSKPDNKLVLQYKVQIITQF